MSIFKKKVDHFDYQANRACITCATHFQGRYCTKCGEKVIEPTDRSFRYFMSGLLNAYTFIDGKFFKSLKTLILAPGQLSADISVGKRQPYMKPIAFFFVANFIYFFFPFFETFNTTLHSQINAMPYSKFVEGMITNHHPDYLANFDHFETLYNQSSTNWSKILLILIVPILFPFIALINYTQRKFLSDQLIYTLEFVSYLLFIPTILYGFVSYLMIKIAEIFDSNIYYIFTDSYTIWITLILMGYFLLKSMKRFYQFAKWRILISFTLIILSIAIVIPIYRFILFYVTIKSI